MAHPPKTKAIPSIRIKADKTDSEILDHLSRSNLVPRSYVVDRKTRFCWELIPYRASLVGHAAMIRNKLHGPFGPKWVEPFPKGLRGRLPKPRRVPSPGLRYAQVHKERQGGQVVEVTRSVIFGKRRPVEAQAASLKRADGSEG